MSENTTSTEDDTAPASHPYYFGPLILPSIEEFAKECVTYAVRDYDAIYITPLAVYESCHSHGVNSACTIGIRTLEPLFAEELLIRQNAVAKLLLIRQKCSNEAIHAQPSTKEDMEDMEAIHSAIAALTKKIAEISADNIDLNTRMQHAGRIVLSAYDARTKLETEYLMLKARVDLMYSMVAKSHAYARQSRWLADGALVVAVITNILYLTH